MNEITNWKFDGIEVRTLTINGEPYFVGKDVVQALGYKNASDALKKHVDDEDKGVANCDTLGGNQELTIINESGLYSLILSCKISQAKRFKRWVTSKVLPSIRKTGSYIEAVPDTDINIEKIEQLRALYDLHMLQANRANKESALALAQIAEIQHVLRHPELLKHADYLLEVKS